MEKVTEYLQTKLNDDDTVIACISGGADSMCLLFLLENIPQKINIVLAHVNHKVRIDSEKEQEYLKSYAKDHNLIYEDMELEPTNKANFESYARQKRYAFFNKLYEKYQAKYIITAHHGDDLIETILMRLNRGSILSGYGGIVQDDGKYLRPLLQVCKDDILKFNKQNNITYFEDYTNAEDEHTRNRFRHYILPLIKEENPKATQKYLDFSKKVSECDRFITSYINKLNIINNDYLSINSLLKEDIFIQKQIIIRLIQKIQAKDEFEVSDKTLEEIFKIIKSPKSNIIKELKNNYVIEKSYDILKIYKKEEIKPFNEEFSQIFQNNMFIIKEVLESSSDGNDIIRLNTKEIKMPLYIRNRHNGDIMEVKNLGHKKVKDIFIDSKISLQERDFWPIVVDSNNNIIWLPNLKKSKFAKDKTEKYDIILASERKMFNE